MPRPLAVGRPEAGLRRAYSSDGSRPRPASLRPQSRPPDGPCRGPRPSPDRPSPRAGPRRGPLAGGAPPPGRSWRAAHRAAASDWLNDLVNDGQSNAEVGIPPLQGLPGFGIERLAADPEAAGHAAPVDESALGPATPAPVRNQIDVFVATLVAGDAQRQHRLFPLRRRARLRRGRRRRLLGAGRAHRGRTGAGAAFRATGTWCRLRSGLLRHDRRLCGGRLHRGLRDLGLGDGLLRDDLLGRANRKPRPGLLHRLGHDLFGGLGRPRAWP